MIEIDLSKVEPMIALPFHPSNAYTIHEFLANAADILAEVEADAQKRFGRRPTCSCTDKIHDGARLGRPGRHRRAAPAACSTTSTEAADILRGGSTGDGYFTLDVYPTSPCP